MFGPLRTGVVLLATLIGLVGPITPAAAQKQPTTVTNVTIVHQTHDNTGKPTGFSAANPDKDHVHLLITYSNGHKIIMTNTLKPQLVQGANGQYHALPVAPTYHPEVKSFNPTINEEKGTKTATYSGTGKLRFHAVYSTQ